MNELVRTGRKRTILISISILLVSIHTIVNYHMIRPEIEAAQLAKQIVRFLLTVGLLILVYQGKNWARVLAGALFALAAAGALTGMLAVDAPNILAKVPLLVMLIVYSMAIYHFGMSISAKAFFEYQRNH